MYTAQQEQTCWCFVLLCLWIVCLICLFNWINQKIKLNSGFVYQPHHPIATPPSFQNQLFLLNNHCLQTQKCITQSSWNGTTLSNGSIQVTGLTITGPSLRHQRMSTRSVLSIFLKLLGVLILVSVWRKFLLVSAAVRESILRLRNEGQRQWETR